MRSALVRTAVAVGAVASFLLATSAPASAPVTSIDRDCFAPQVRLDPQVVNGVSTNPAWLERDTVNQYCATLRLRDQAGSPAYGTGNVTLGAQLYQEKVREQLADGPGHLHGGLTTLVPGSQSADAFRSVEAWEKRTGGTATRVTFTASDGARLHGHLWMPPRSVPKPKGGYPGIVITDGSVQAYEQLYYWAAQGLTQYGYQVLTYDVQGQGESDLLPASCTPTSCPGVPYQQSYNFYQGAEDSLSWFASRANPGYSSLNRTQLGIAGHSLGAAAVSWVGQCDSRVKTIVAWDDLQPIDLAKCATNVSVPKAFRATKLDTPALATTNDYEFNVQPAAAPPNPHGGTNGGGGAGDSGYLSLVKAGVDSQLVSFRNGTHLTYSYIPLVLPSNQLSERFAFHYTLAWFDQYLRDGVDPYTPLPALTRLTSLGSYDSSADRSSRGVVSFGTGTYDATAGNQPYLVKGIPVPDSLSFYYFSQYRLTDPRTRAVRTCVDMVAHCPSRQPGTP